MKLYLSFLEIESCGDCPNCKVIGIPENIMDWDFYCSALGKEEPESKIKSFRNNNTVSPYCPLEDFIET